MRFFEKKIDFLKIAKVNKFAAESVLNETISSNVFSTLIVSFLATKIRKFLKMETVEKYEEREYFQKTLSSL